MRVQRALRERERAGHDGDFVGVVDRRQAELEPDNAEDQSAEGERKNDDERAPWSGPAVRAIFSEHSALPECQHVQEAPAGDWKQA